jgi:tRNA dimethylallyltransferase
VALALARQLGATELVSVDAMAVYRRIDIATAKPSAAERAEVPYHGLDLVEPWEELSVVGFQQAVAAALRGIDARGNRAVLVAGTGLYLRAVIDGLEPPGEYPEVRRELDAEPSTEALHRRLAALDPLAASRMEPSNRRRVVRALEVCLGSGRPFSSFGPGLTAYPPSPVVQLGLRWPRAMLTRRIEERFAAMLRAGLLEETAALAADPRGLSRTAAQALGTKELLLHLQGELSLADAVALAVTRTRQLAVRQERWFRRDPRIHWVDLRDHPLEAVPHLLELLHPCPS